MLQIWRAFLEYLGKFSDKHNDFTQTSALEL